MISEKDKSKLKFKILKSMYNNYHLTNSLIFDNLDLAMFYFYNFDDHDIELALKSLKADGFVEIEFDINNKVSKVVLTQNGVDYCNANRDSKFVQYLKKNHLAIIDLFLSAIAIIISIIALYYSLNQ